MIVGWVLDMFPWVLLAMGPSTITLPKLGGTAAWHVLSTTVKVVRAHMGRVIVCNRPNCIVARAWRAELQIVRAL